MATPECATASQITREEAEKALMFPMMPITARSSAQESQRQLYTLLTQCPEQLDRLGISQIDLYKPVCTDPALGRWEVARNPVWIDKTSGVPLDHATIRIEERLPADLSKVARSELIKLLPPTYFRHQVDAKALATFLQAAGPMSEWK